MKRVGCATLVTGLVAVLSSCYPGDVTNITELDLVVTAARPDYKKKKTDILVINAIAVNVNVSVWTWWPGYYPPYWGCCYGGYPWWPVSGATAWKSGTVVTLMKDRAEETVNDDDGMVWVGGMNGLAEGSSDVARSRIVGGIDQAFTQSPYLSGGGS